MLRRHPTMKPIWTSISFAPPLSLLAAAVVILFSTSISQATLPADEIRNSVCPKLKKLEVVPGRGWDNLRNKEMGQVTQLTYNSCRVTEDGQFLIPDNSYVIPIKQSSIELRSELIEHWSNYTDMTANSINVNGGLSGRLRSISGSYSSEYQRTKQHQVNDKSVTNRVHFRTTMYVVGAEPSMSLDPTFANLLLQANYEISANNTLKADFLLELIVRDYGTHMLKRLDAGALIYQEDFLTSKFVSSDENTRNSIKIAASASFSGKFNFGAQYSHTITTGFLEAYNNATTSSSVRSIGGDVIKPNASVNDWIDTIPNNLVAVDRAGEPLHFVITPEAFPALSLPSLSQLSSRLEAAIKRYYRHNIRIGCTNADSPNFDYSANSDDKSCHSPYNNYTFGGIFQSCVTTADELGDLCLSHQLRHENILTGDYTCRDGFEQILLRTDTVHDSRTTCSVFLIWEWCEEEKSQSTYSAYWCAALGVVPSNTGFMFGGVFTSLLPNPLTKDNTCPPTFISLPLLQDLHVCVGNDYEIGFRFSVPFGGFFSCSNGNPLYTALKTNLVGVDLSLSSSSASNQQYTYACSPGFSQHVAVIEQSCEVNYCVKANSFGQNGDVRIVLPPFHKLKTMFSESKTDDGSRSGISGGAIAVILVSILVAVGLPVAIALYCRKRRQERAGYREINGDDNIVQVDPEVITEVISEN